MRWKDDRQATWSMSPATNGINHNASSFGPDYIGRRIGSETRKAVFSDTVLQFPFQKRQRVEYKLAMVNSCRRYICNNKKKYVTIKKKVDGGSEIVW